MRSMRISNRHILGNEPKWNGDGIVRGKCPKKSSGQICLTQGDILLKIQENNKKNCIYGMLINVQVS